MSIKAPKIVKTTGQWEGYNNPVWHKKDRDKVTILYKLDINYSIITGNDIIQFFIFPLKLHHDIQP